MLQKVSEVRLIHGNDIEARNAALMKLLPSQHRFTTHVEALKEVITVNRFKLGETEYKKFQQYEKVLMALPEGFADGNLERFKAISPELDAPRRSLANKGSLM